MPHRICAIPGDGIGQEVVPAAVRVLRALLPDLGWWMPRRASTASGAPAARCRPRRWQAIAACEATLFGAVSSPSTPVAGLSQRDRHHAPALPAVRLRAARPQRGPVPDARPGIDLLIVRENTEGLYVGRETAYGDYAEATR